MNKIGTAEVVGNMLVLSDEIAAQLHAAMVSEMGRKIKKKRIRKKYFKKFLFRILLEGAKRGRESHEEEN